MAKCIECGKSNAEYLTNSERAICSKCTGKYFQCADCGRIFLEPLSDAGDGFCVKCSREQTYK